MGCVSQRVFQEGRQIQLRHQRLKLQVLAAKALVIFQKLGLVIFRRENVLRAAMGHQSHQQIEVRRRRPRGIGPFALDWAQLSHGARPRPHKRVVAATVEDNQNVVIALSVFAFAAFAHFNVPTILLAMIRCHAALCSAFIGSGPRPIAGIGANCNPEKYRAVRERIPETLAPSKGRQYFSDAAVANRFENEY